MNVLKILFYRSVLDFERSEKDLVRLLGNFEKLSKLSKSQEIHVNFITTGSTLT